MKHRSIKFRLTVLFVLIFGSTLVLMSIAGYRFFVSNEQADFDAALYNHATDMASEINSDALGRLSIKPGISDALNKIQPFSIERTYKQIRSVDGTVIAKSLNLGNFELPLSHEDIKSLFNNFVVFNSVAGKMLPNLDRRANSYRVVSLLVGTGAHRFILQVAAPLSYLERIYSGLFWFLVLAVPAVLIFATLAGLYMARRALEPVSLIISKAGQMGASQLSERLPVSKTGDEIDRLAVTINGLLERVERSVVATERFVAHASHQIKTPLAILKGELAIFLTRPRDAAETHEFLTSAAQEIDSLSTLIENLLVLARVDAGAESLEMKHNRIDELLMDVLTSLGPLARKKNIQFKVNLMPGAPPEAGTSFDVVCDGELLRTMMMTLVENAIKYSNSDSTIEVSLMDSSENTSLLVRDTGIGIEAADLPHIFDAFFRSRSAKPDAKGFGLGLAIARQIAVLHGGRITAESKPGEYTELRFTLPRWD